METVERKKRTPRQHAYIVGTGAAMGAADVVPGVSGGTMAFIMGVYEELIDAIKSFNLTFLRLLFSGRFRAAFDYVNGTFVLALGAGLGTAILSLARVLSWLLEHQREYLFAFFFGLILASILAVSAHVRWRLPMWGTLVGGSVVAFWLAGLAPSAPLESPSALHLFLGGAVAISAMLLPGVSGALILLTLGLYDFLIAAVKSLDVGAVVPAVAGMVAGIMLFARLLSWLLKRYHQVTVTLLIGFMIGSLRVIWPFKTVVETRIDRHGDEVPAVMENILPQAADVSIGLALSLCLAGFLLISVLDHLQSKSNPVLRWAWKA